MAGELSRLCRRALGKNLDEPRKAGTGALIYPFDPEVARVAALYHRTGSRALWDRAESRAQRLEPLYDDLVSSLVADVDAWLWDGASISVRARNIARFAAGERQVIGTVKNAVIEAAAARALEVTVDADQPDVTVHVRMHDDVVTVSADLVGEAMHRRGYRRDGGEAPLRENLAAVLVMLSRWDARREPLLDPMAGSGTIAIEAALMATAAPLRSAGRSADLFRMPALSRLPRDGAPLFADTQAQVIANELDTPTVALTRETVDRAGAPVTVAHGDFRNLHRSRIARLLDRRELEPGVILCNPPYGERLDHDAELAELYRDLGRWCRDLRGWRAGFLVANPEFEESFGLRARIRKPLSNGPLRGYFYLYDL